MDDNDDDDGGGGGRPCNRHRADRTEEGNDTVSRVGGLRHIYRKLHRHHHRSHRRFSETRSIDPSVRLLSSGHQASNFHFPNVTPPLPSLKGSLSKMRTNLRRSRRLIRTAFVYMLCMYMCVYVCVYIWVVESGCRDLSLSREDVGWSFSIVGLFGARPFRSRPAFSISHPSPHLRRYRATSSFSSSFFLSSVRPTVLYARPPFFLLPFLRLGPVPSSDISRTISGPFLLPFLHPCHIS